MDVKKPKKSKHFLEQPQYPGGRKALDAFIAAHLQYPADAIQQHLEGTVTIAYQVTDEGEIENPTVIKGLSPSCNEEAIRLVKMLKYGKAHNRGYRLKANCKIHINFHLAPAPPATTLNISYSVTSSKSKPVQKKSSSSIQYSITIK